MKPIDFHPGAADEAREAAARYEAIRPGPGVAFRAELSAPLGRVEDNPTLDAAEAGSLRVAPLRRFPYAVIYEGLDERLWVAAIGHHRRRPGHWAGRRPV